MKKLVICLFGSLSFSACEPHLTRKTIPPQKKVDSEKSEAGFDSSKTEFLMLHCVKRLKNGELGFKRLGGYASDELTFASDADRLRFCRFVLLHFELEGGENWSSVVQLTFEPGTSPGRSKGASFQKQIFNTQSLLKLLADRRVLPDFAYSAACLSLVGNNVFDVHSNCLHQKLPACIKCHTKQEWWYKNM
jgi:hypothetical protein